MRRFLAAIFFFLMVQLACAQEPVKSPVLEKDSLLQEKPLFSEPGIVLPDIKDEIPVLMDFKAKLDAPAFDFSRYLNSRWRVDYSSWIDNKHIPGIFPGFQSGTFFSPFGGSGTIFNQAVYQLSGKLLIGGNSFGLNPVGSVPFNRSVNGPYDVRGASVFMEYKVSKNFRIGGGITVSHNSFQP